MSDELGLSIDDVPVIKNAQESTPDFNASTKMAADAVNSIESSVKLTEETKDKIKKNKGKKKIEVLQTNNSSDLTEAEIAEAIALNKDIQQFVIKNTDLKDDREDIAKFPTGIKLLDAILGGGIGVGTFTMIVGKPGTFKSALASQILANCQKLYRGMFYGRYYDSESAMTMERLYNLGVRSPRIQPNDDVTVESVFKTIEAFISWKMGQQYDIPGLLVWDSIANTSTDKERTTVDINQTIGLKARLISALLPRYVPKMREHKISLLAINQLREAMQMGQFSPAADIRWMGDAIIPGGQSLKYNSFHLINLKIRGDLKPEQFGFNGVSLEAKTVKNKFFTPNIASNLIVDFNTGISDFWSNYKFLGDLKIIKTGAWNNFADEALSSSWRTADAKEMYDENKDGFKDRFDKLVDQAIKTEIIDKYSYKEEN